MTAKLPDSFSKLPADDNWKDVKAARAGQEALDQAILPKVFVSTDPAELIVLAGAISYKPIQGAPTLLWVRTPRPTCSGWARPATSTSSSPAAGSSRPGLDGPWTFATTSLPEDFKKIPIEHDALAVLASVPGTPQATEAVLLARFLEPPA